MIQTSKVISLIAFFLSMNAYSSDDSSDLNLPGPKLSSAMDLNSCDKIFSDDDRPTGVDRLNQQYISQINKAKERIRSGGGHTPESLYNLDPRETISFHDGASFRVSNPTRLTSNYVRFDFTAENPEQFPATTTDDFELLVAAYSGENPSLGEISDGLIPNEHPRESFQFLRKNYDQLQKLVPLRRFLYISKDGMYAIPEKIKPYKGSLMTLRRFAKDQSLSLEEREALSDSLENFLLSAIHINFTTLILGKMLVYDPSDRRWKLQMVDTSLRRNFGDNLVNSVLYTLELSADADDDFIQQLYFRLKEVDRKIEQLVDLEIKQRQFEKALPYAGVYKFDITLGSEQHIIGTINMNSLIEKKGNHLK